MMRIHFVAPVGRIFYACMPLSRHARTHIRPAQRADTRVCVWIPRRAPPPARAHKHAVHGMRVWHGRSASCCAWCGNQHPSPRAPCVCARQRPQQVPLPTPPARCAACAAPLSSPVHPAPHPREGDASPTRRATRMGATPRISPRGRRNLSHLSTPPSNAAAYLSSPRRVVDTIFIHPQARRLSGGFSPRRLAVEA